MSGLYRHRFKLLLASLVGIILIVPVAMDLFPRRTHMVDALAVLVVSTLGLLAGTMIVSGRRRAALFALYLAVPSLLLEAAAALTWPGGFLLCHHLLRLVVLGFVILELLRRLFRPDPVTFDTLCASLCVYLLLGVAWAHVYLMMDSLVPGSVIAVVRPGPGLEESGGDTALYFRMLYFSFATLTGVGYGDVVPATTTARMFAVTEAMSGQAYLYVMVGRLVGIQVAQAFAPPADPAAPKRPEVR
jgi:hypothetical protein